MRYIEFGEGKEKVSELIIGLMRDRGDVCERGNRADSDWP